MTVNNRTYTPALDAYAEAVQALDTVAWHELEAAFNPENGEDLARLAMARWQEATDAQARLNKRLDELRRAALLEMLHLRAEPVEDAAARLEALRRNGGSR